VGPAGRARIASAVSEILDNARRHAYEQESGRVLVTAFADAGKRVSIVVQDFGRGFALEEDRNAFGLARASALAESLRVDSSLGSGTRVELEFDVWPVRFEGDDVIDLSELDWLPPALTQKVLSRLETGESPFRLSPALAVTVGRLLAAKKKNTPSLHSELADGSLRSRHGA
ncbi:MAG: ATP-binding protein, partial [Planctomycetota bacterium]